MTKPTPVVSIETAYAIWMAHQQIAAGQKLLDDIALAHEQDRDRRNPLSPQPSRGYQLGIPAHMNGHTLINVDPALAESCIKAHIERKRAELAEVSLRALVEMGAG
jgi:hypothetical protein